MFILIGYSLNLYKTIHCQIDPYENTARDLNHILEAENIDKAVLVGMSMGGFPSQQFAHMFPSRVMGFVAIDTTPFGLCYYSKSDMWWLKRSENIARLYPANLLRKMMAKSVSKTEYSYNLMMNMLNNSTKDEICKQIGIAYGAFIKENKDVSFDFPVLILLGDCDKTGKVKKYSEMLAEKEVYPLHIIKHAAHFSNADNYEQTNFEIQNFVSHL